jgi:hypothetical protein
LKALFSNFANSTYLLFLELNIALRFASIFFFFLRVRGLSKCLRFLISRIIPALITSRLKRLKAASIDSPSFTLTSAKLISPILIYLNEDI